MFKKVKISLIKPQKDKENSLIYKCLLKSILQYGQLYPIIIDKEFNIIKGNKTYHALLEAEETDIVASIVEECNYVQLRHELNTIKEPLNIFEIMTDYDVIDVEDNCLPYHISDFKKFKKYSFDYYKPKESDALNKLF